MPIVLTGIKPTGTPHLGNYLGAIRPSLAAAREAGQESRFFIADVHALNQGLAGPALRTAALDVAAAWIACGLDTGTTLLYRQSDVPEILELSVLLTPLASKGLMNRAHAYKAKAAENRRAGRDADDGVNMGLFTYPILMAADILAFDTDLVPVGSDQVQHVEMAVDLARSANRKWGPATLKEPRAAVSEAALVPGTDGRKMSKSYGNVLPLFADGKTLAALVRKVPTDSQPVEAPKDPASNPLAAWYRCADPAAGADFERRLRAGGLGWGEAKAEVAQALERLLAPAAAAFRELRRDELRLQAALEAGAAQARILAQKVLRRVKERVF